MTKRSLPVKTIPSEEAVFWMDRQGRWHNEHGPFEHKKIIDYFNASIQKDEQGYFVGQELDGVFEKVYFNYVDTPLVVVDAVSGNPVELLLNTGRLVSLIPENLYVQSDNLYMAMGDEKVRFSERVLLKLSNRLSHDGTSYFFETGGQRQRIPERD